MKTELRRCGGALRRGENSEGAKRQEQQSSQSHPGTPCQRLSYSRSSGSAANLLAECARRPSREKLAVLNTTASVETRTLKTRKFLELNTAMVPRKGLEPPR